MIITFMEEYRFQRISLTSRLVMEAPELILEKTQPASFIVHCYITLAADS